ncbi:type II toxin-antitoxin system YafQ family toxin [Nostoc sp. ChiQUE01b]|uniref:type II toxin-antitoxin system RelE/ParE family toxin n=1 Tax=Nostoc sp. ChiQUE01b TaxID=3075376 RepID=UPI002AD290AD|nr:type II toxin-antitoxin system YafQ family toxin [Nostoc sp. ChiQUE01b]
MNIEYTKKARQGERNAGKRGKDLQKLRQVLHYFQQDIPLPARFRKHRLWQSEYKGAWEVHIEPNWLLVYQIVGNTVLLIRCGTHPDIFK